MTQTELAVAGDGWTGHISIVDNVGPMSTAQIWSESEVSGDNAIVGLEYMLQLVASGREVVFRVKPEVHKEQGFGEQNTGWRGVTRIQFKIPADGV